MQHRTLGNTGLKVSRLGVGLSELGDLRLEDEGIAARVLNTALDNGINFFDTAACYGNSEELFGRSLANRRDEYVLSTKAGHAWSDDNGESWTAETVRRRRYPGSAGGQASGQDPLHRLQQRQRVDAVGRRKRAVGEPLD
ncbi:MAG TPA: aldo/keto reductase [Denitromonas sp.]|nr:aldo/keto reductase [Denitromonas sp.]